MMMMTMTMMMPCYFPRGSSVHRGLGPVSLDRTPLWSTRLVGLLPGVIPSRIMMMMMMHMMMRRIMMMNVT